MVPTFRRMLHNVTLLLLSGMFMAGCALYSNNLTPRAFPWDVTQPDWYPSNLLNGNQTANELNVIRLQPATPFILETKRDNVSDVSAYVTVNGVEHAMAKYGSHNGDGIWLYHPDRCHPSYQYHFRMRYHAGLYGWETKTIGSPAEPLSVSASGFGNLVWNRGYAPVQSGNGQVNLNNQDREAFIFLRNLQNGTIRIDSIAFDSSDPDYADFEKFDSPTTQVVLNCGDIMRFGVRYLGSGASIDVLEMRVFTSFSDGSGGWNQNPSQLIIRLIGSSAGG